MISIKDKVIRNPKVAFRVIDGEAILLTPHNSMIHTFNPIGTVIWSLLDKEKTISKLVNAIKDEYEVKLKEAEQDVLEFIEQLYQRKMVLINNKAVENGDKK
jgi:hypothetical protein